VCNNRYNHHSCKDECSRADIPEASVILQIGKLAERREVVSNLVREFTDHNRTRRLPELEARRQALFNELERIRGEQESLSRWLSGARLTAQAVEFINSQVDRLSEQEGQVQERLWAVEDRIKVGDNTTAPTVDARGVASLPPEARERGRQRCTRTAT
jgi:hypothetical protein